MREYSYVVHAATDLVCVNTHVYAHDEEQAEQIGLQQIREQLGLDNTEMFFSVEIECEDEVLV